MDPSGEKAKQSEASSVEWQDVSEKAADSAPDFGRNDFGRGSLNEQLDVDALVDEIGLDESEIDWRKEFIGFDRDDVERLQQYEDAFRSNAEQVAADFYDNITDHEQTVEVIGRSDKGVEQLKRTQSAYLVTLANGDYGREYFRDRARIGKIHDLLDMPMKHYLGQYSVYYDLIFSIVRDRLVDTLTDRLAGPEGAGRPETAAESNGQRDRPDDAAAADTTEAIIEAEVDDGIQDLLSIMRIINLDMQVVTDTYIHSYSQQLETEVERNEQLMKEVQDGVRGPVAELKTSFDDVVESTVEVSETTDAQAEQTDQIASEVSDLSATIEEVASTAEQVETTSDEAERLAQEGKDAADDATEVMAGIGDAVEATREDIGQLQDSVQTIDEFVAAINEISKQTNILALNAQIEAARAGEAGEGFAVVAEEVEDLAEQSNEHASTVEQQVESVKEDTELTVESLAEMTQQVEQGIDRVQDAMESLTGIVEIVSETAQGISEVSEATDDQAASSEEIASMIDEVALQSERVAGEIDDVAALSREQATMIDDVEETIAKLTESDAATDGGGASAETEPPRDALPDAIPDSVVESLTDAQIRAIDRGEIDPADVL
jgi:heme-based aerotactic transducer